MSFDESKLLMTGFRFAGETGSSPSLILIKDSYWAENHTIHIHVHRSFLEIVKASA